MLDVDTFTINIYNIPKLTHVVTLNYIPKAYIIYILIHIKKVDCSEVVGYMCGAFEYLWQMLEYIWSESFVIPCDILL